MSAAFSPDGKRIVTASLDGTARIWDATTGKPLCTPLDHRGYVVSAVFSLDGSHVVTASYDDTARIWDTRLDHGSLEEWSALARRGTFVLSRGVLSLRTAPPQTGESLRIVRGQAAARRGQVPTPGSNEPSGFRAGSAPRP